MRRPRAVPERLIRILVARTQEEAILKLSLRSELVVSDAGRIVVNHST